ncbi:MAG TPA: DUF2189 domain-containing protein [Alphaproteobacteria bacterium]|nr:DUF2189 domain-containing protein [Alphaproteobacteria bacterium]
METRHSAASCVSGIDEAEEQMIDAVPVFQTPSPKIRLIPIDRPWLWLAEGWRDLLRAPGVSVAYGGLLVGISLALALALYLFDLLYLLLPLTAGFMFVAPLLAVGLYETSRRLASNEPVSLEAALSSWRRNPGQLSMLGTILMLFHLAWVRVAMLLYPLFFQGPNPSLGNLPDILFFSPMSLPFLVTGTAIGAVLASLVFAITAVSIPMLIDRNVGVVTAVATSFVAVRHNWQAMTLWAALIVFFTGFGLVAFFVGLAFAVPLVGHATWHCYKDVVE